MTLMSDADAGQSQERPLHCVFMITLLVIGLWIGPSTPVSAQSTTELIVPGKYTSMGRIVSRSTGELAVFWGGGCYRFPKKVQEKLRPHIGEFVVAHYTRIGDRQAGTFSVHGSVIDRIDRVERLTQDHPNRAVSVRLTLGIKEFRLNEPIRLSVEITNTAKASQRIQLMVSKTWLSQDYMGVVNLESESHYYDTPPYGHPDLTQVFSLRPKQTVTFPVVSSRMLQPGKYQLVYVLRVEGILSQSQTESVCVLSAADAAEEMKALKYWVKRATVGQRVSIAKKLMQNDETSGRDEVLRLLEAGAYTKGSFFHVRATSFAWRHGGKRGEAVMINLIQREWHKYRVVGMIRGISLSPNRIQLFESLLSGEIATKRSSTGWGEGLRISDITAALLMGYTQGKMKFPRRGTEGERNRAVIQVRKQLEKDPSYFSLLSELPH